MRDVFLCDGVRTPIGRYGGALAAVRADDLAAVPLRQLLERHPALRGHIGEVVLGCANQAGEDNRNVARMASLLAGLGEQQPALTVNRLCASGLDAVAAAARAIRAGEIDLAIAGGVESMTRAPLVMAKSETAFQRGAEIFDTTIGWRFVNKALKEQYGSDAMPETAENVAADFAIGRDDQDAYALRSQLRAAAARDAGIFARQIVPVIVPGGKAGPVTVALDEHPRATTMEALAKLKPIVRPGGTVTAGNAAGINDGAAAMILASAGALDQFGLTPRARILGMASAGVAPRVMGIGPVPAVQKLLGRLGLAVPDIDAIELNEAFASQVLACLRQLGIADDAPHVNPFGGAVVSQFEFSGLGAVLPGKRGKQRTVTLSKGVTQRLTVPSHRSVTNAPPPGIGVVSYRNKKAIVAATMTNPTNTVPPTNLCVRHMATCPQT
jgi:3-oxoadipyl-CoA thiolase